MPFGHPLFLNPFAKFTQKGISLFHLYVCLFQHCTSHNMFWGFFGRMEVRLFLTINHSGPLMTRSFPERGQREQVGDVKSGYSKSPDFSNCSGK